MDPKFNWSKITEFGYQALASGRIDQAERFFRFAIEAGKFEGHDTRAAESLLIIGQGCLKRGDYKSAESFYRQALEIYERVHGNTHKDVALSLSGLACCNMHSGKYTEAQLLYLRVISIYEQLYAPDIEEIAFALCELAECYIHQHDCVHAIPYYCRAIEIFEKIHGPYHACLAESLHALARCFDEENDVQQAEPLFRRALEIYQPSQPRNERIIAQLFSNLARCHHQQQDFTQAASFYRQASELLERLKDMEIQLAYCLYGLACCYLSSGDYSCEETFKRCIATYHDVFGKQSPRLAPVLESYARFLANTCRSQEAQQIEQRAQEILKNSISRRDRRPPTGQ